MEAEHEDKSSRSSTRNRLAFWLGVTAMATLVLGAAWLVVTGLIARAQLQGVRSELPRLRQAVLDNRMPEARRLAAQIRTQAARAHALTTGPAWWVSAHLPGVGTPLSTTRVLARAADRLGDQVVPTVVRLADEASRARAGESSIDLAPIRRLAPQLHRAAAAAERARLEVAGSAGSWFGPVSSARSSVLDQLTRVDGELTGADRAVGIALPMLGYGRPQRYFIGFLNEAEARGVGGIPGAFAIATADNGRLTFDHFGSDAEFHAVRAAVDLPADFDALYGQDDPTGVYVNSNLSPDFRSAARIWAGLWEAKTGQRIDAAVGLDPTALSYLLAVTGPAQTVEGQSITAANVVALTQRDLYARFGALTPSDSAARKRYVIGLAGAVSHRLARGGDPRQLVRAFARAAAQRRFVVWSAQPAVERDLEAAHWAGGVDGTAGRTTTGFVVNNAAGSKLDYYLNRSFSYVRAGCAAGSVATATLRLTNAAPADLPPYVTTRADSGRRAAKRGDNRLLITYYASAGARIRSVTLDGKAVEGTSGSERGLPVRVIEVELPRGRSRTVRVDITEPAASGRVSVIRQPLVRPLGVQLRAPTCG